MNHSEFQTLHLFDGSVRIQYLFRAPVKYYVFLLMQFLSEKPIIAQCENCGNFFVPKTKKKTLYCDRIIADGKTCKQVAPKQKHKKLAENDPVIEAYDRTRRKMYKRLERAVDTPFPKSPILKKGVDDRYGCFACRKKIGNNSENEKEK